MFVWEYACLYGSMYVCMGVCMFVWEYACLYGSMYVCMGVCMFGSMYVCMGVSMYGSMYSRTSLVRTLLMSNTWLGSTRI